MTTTAHTPRSVRPANISGLWGPILVILATAVVLTINVLANALPINGQDTGEISDRFPVYFTPAGYVFSIWGVIYLGLIAYTVYQALPRRRDETLLRAIAPWYLLSAVANTLWILAWHYNQVGISVLIMLVLLVSLGQIYRRLAARRPASNAELWAVHVPFRIYLGWICVATIANTTTLLYAAGWNGFGISEVTWTVIMVAVAGMLGLLFSLLRADSALVAVLIWAIFGIAYKHSAVAPIAWTAYITMAILALSLVVSLPRRRRQLARA